jgi:hypothetical protein
LVVTIGGITAAIVLAPASTPGGSADPALNWLLFVGASVHVAASGWLVSVPEVRAHAWRHRSRYVWAPVALIAGGAFAAGAVPAAALEWLLLVFFAWQFLHFQKQNLGLVALAASSHGARSLDARERGALLLAGRAATVAIIARPQLLGLGLDPGVPVVFPAAAVTFSIAAVSGARAVRLRSTDQRPAPFVAMYAMAFAFWSPVFLARTPYTAIGGLVIAHGLQYLLLIALVAAGRRDVAPRSTTPAAVATVVLAGAAMLSAASHLHTAGPPTRWIYGAYLGIVSSHFVIDAGLWRLRDSFPREFLSARVPYLVPARSVTDLQCSS